MCDGGNLHSMQSSNQVYRALKGAEFSDTQARALVQILQAAGLVEPEAPESELERIEQYLMADPFEAVPYRDGRRKELPDRTA